jgi:hypothetical protein
MRAGMEWDLRERARLGSSNQECQEASRIHTAYPQ